MNSKLPGGTVRRVLTSVLLLLISFALAIGLAEGALRLLGHTPWTPVRLFDAAPAMTEPDAELGWVNRAGHYRYNPSNQPGGEIEVSISADHSRSIPSPTAGPAPLWFMGCSFTFGWGVSDGSDYPAVAASLLAGKHAVKNWGAPGYGTVQSYLLFERLIREQGPRPYAVVYGLVEFHDERNVAPRSWLRLLSRAASRQSWVQVPALSLDAGGGERFEPPRGYRKWLGAEHLALVNLAQETTDNWLDRPLQSQGPEATVRTILRWQKAANGRGIRFAVALLHAPGRGDFYRRRLREAGVPYIDISGTPYPAPGTTVPRDGHPNASIHRLWGQALAEHLARF